MASGWSMVFSVNEIDLQLILEIDISLSEALSTHETSITPPLFVEVPIHMYQSSKVCGQFFFIFLRFCYLILELFRHRGILRFFNLLHNSI